MSFPSVPNDNFARDIAQYRYENRKTLFAHLPRNDWPKLVPMSRASLLGRLSKNNPFWPVEPMKAKVPPKARPSILRSEVPRVYSAMAFAMWQYGKLMNAHLTICWKLLGVTDSTKAVEILSKYNHDVNRLTNLTPYRRPILTPSRGVV